MALTTNVARDPEWDLKPRTWHKEPGRNPGRVSHERGTKNPGRNPGRVSHERGTENQKGTPEESATNVAQRTRKEPRKNQPRTWHREPERNPGRVATNVAQRTRKEPWRSQPRLRHRDLEKESWRRADRRRTERSRPERSRPATPRERERGPQSLEVDENR
jgi:hypothetical protein